MKKQELKKIKEILLINGYQTDNIKICSKTTLNFYTPEGLFIIIKINNELRIHNNNMKLLDVIIYG